MKRFLHEFSILCLFFHAAEAFWRSPSCEGNLHTRSGTTYVPERILDRRTSSLTGSIAQVFMLSLNQLLCVFRPRRKLRSPFSRIIFYLAWLMAVMDRGVLTWLTSNPRYFIVGRFGDWHMAMALREIFLPLRWSKVVSSISYKMGRSSHLFHFNLHYTLQAHSTLYINSPAFQIRASVVNFPRHCLSYLNSSLSSAIIELLRSWI